MINVHDDTLTELKEIADKGIGHLRRRIRTYTPIIPIKTYNSHEIKAMREKNNFTQSYFGELFGVSIKTVQAWETGTNRPNGTALRMLQILEQDPHAMVNYFLL